MEYLSNSLNHLQFPLLMFYPLGGTRHVGELLDDEDAHSGVQGDLLPFKLGDKSKGRKGYAAGQPARGKVVWGAMWLLIFMDSPSLRTTWDFHVC